MYKYYTTVKSKIIKVDSLLDDGAESTLQHFTVKRTSMRRSQLKSWRSLV